MNSSNQPSPKSTAERVISNYGIPPSETTRHSLRSVLEKEREAFHALAKIKDKNVRRLREREERDR